MGRRRSPEKVSDREKNWDKVFNALVRLSENLKKDREFLERKVKSLQEFVYRMQIEQKFESLKANLKLGLKEREAFTYKNRYGNPDKANDDISDLQEWLDCIAKTYAEPKRTSDVSSKGKASQNKALRDELKRLKGDIEKYKLEKKAEIASLLAEKKFIWNQYNKLENDFTEKFRKKCDEVEHVSENVQHLVNTAEQLQKLNEQLRSDLDKAESESAHKSEEISRLTREIELLKSRSGSDMMTPSWPPRHAPSCSEGKSSTSNGRVIITKKNGADTVEKVSLTKRTSCKSTGEKVNKKPLAIEGSKSFKRKAIEVINIPDTPKLFSSAFKIPKLKHSFSPQAA